MSQVLLRVARFTSGLPHCIALAFVAVAGVHAFHANARLAVDATALAAAAGLSLVVPVLSAAFVARRPFAERMLIIGMSPLARKILDEIATRCDCPYVVVGVAGDQSEGLEAPFPELHAGPVEHLGAIIDALRPDRIVVALADRRGRLPVRELLESRVRGVAVDDGVELYERLTGKIAIESLTPSNLISSKDFRKSHLDLAFGHALSLLVSAIGLIVLAPLFALIAVALKLDSPGPIFFVQDRVGAGGHRFKLRKFRTMRPADGTTSEWVRDNGDRITRVGAWLRRYRLDELPQLINILRGEMNLVGPRPHPVSNVGLFTEHIPFYSLRSVVRPGLTGWAQVCQGYANGLEEETEKMRYDLYYIKHMSAWLDLRILFRTVRSVLCGRETKAARRARHAVRGSLMGRLRLGRLRFATSPARAKAPRPTPFEPGAASVLTSLIASERHERRRSERVGP
jgi:exopolysaccharide biosynthesis polyprenyl glycosylphosphotransferase